jgi:hypothetical protein
MSQLHYATSHSKQTAQPHLNLRLCRDSRIVTYSSLVTHHQTPSKPTTNPTNSIQTKLPPFPSLLTVSPESSDESLTSLRKVSALCLGVLNPEVWNSLDSLGFASSTP